MEVSSGKPAATEKVPPATVVGGSSQPMEASSSRGPPQSIAEPSTSSSQSQQQQQQQHSTSSKTDSGATSNAPVAASTSDSQNAKQEPPSSEGDDPDTDQAQRIYQANAESFNGAIRDAYSWSQSITDVDVRLKIPPHVRKGNDVQVTIEKKRLKAKHRDDSGQWVEVVDSELCWDVNKEESMWSLVPAEHIHVNLEKVQERWWDAVFVDEPKLNVRAMECSRPMTDLDDEAQAKIEQMMWDDHRKKLGLPTSEQIKMEGMLKKAWDAEGSPFRGQPFDPSKVNLQSGGDTFPPSMNQ